MNVVVIGAGASGLIAAGTAAKNGHSVSVLERNDRPGRKLMLTGKGRCNITNMSDTANYIKMTPVNGKFLFSCLNAFTPSDIINLLENYGVKTKTERGNRVFPVSDTSRDIVDALVKFAVTNGVKIIKGRAVNLKIDNGIIKAVILEDGNKIEADYVIICTGGVSYPLTGSTGDGYTLAKKAGHKITTPSPSLVPITVKEKFVRDLMGLTLKNVKLKIKNETSNKIIFEEQGELLFTHFGISGPLVLSASSHMRNVNKYSYSAIIDLKPALDYSVLDTRLQKDFNINAGKIFANSLGALLPKSFIPVFVKQSGIEPQTKTNQITKEMRGKIAFLLKNFKLSINGFRPIDEAIITSGGVDTNEIDPKTMKSKLVPNLSFAGEVIDVDAYTGGYNLQIAFSTGYVAGISIDN